MISASDECWVWLQHPKRLVGCFSWRNPLVDLDSFIPIHLRVLEHLHVCSWSSGPVYLGFTLCPAALQEGTNTNLHVPMVFWGVSTCSEWKPSTTHSSNIPMLKFVVNWEFQPILGGGFKYLFIFIPIWGRLPFWLIFFRWVETTN